MFPRVYTTDGVTDINTTQETHSARARRRCTGPAPCCRRISGHDPFYMSLHRPGSEASVFNHAFFFSSCAINCFRSCDTGRGYEYMNIYIHTPKTLKAPVVRQGNG